jgi:hypothetical protein
MMLDRRLIWDDDGQRMAAGSLVLVNGLYEHVIHWEGDEICIHDWPEDEMIFSVERVPDPVRFNWPDEI